MEENYIDKEIGEILAHLRDYMALDGLKASFTEEAYMAKEAFDVELSHRFLKEADQFLHDGNQLTLPSLLDLEPFFQALDKQAVLAPVELFNILDLLSASEAIYDLFQDKKQYEHLYDNAMDLNPLVGLKRELALDIENDNTVSDNASAKLKEVRSEIRGLQRELSTIMGRYKSRYGAYLSSDTIQMKGEDETLPVKAQYKNNVKGMIVAYSSTGETAFIVPYEVMEKKNELRSLQDTESDEVMKILFDLSKKCSKQLPTLRRDYEILMLFDRYFAAIRYGQSYDGQISVQSKDVLSLQGLFHPLLTVKKVVTNSIVLGGQEPRSLVITGPNAGGKSVFITAVAVAVKMDKLGLLVPCHGEVQIPFIDEVYFLGGDNQSVLDNLSTFSSHLYGIKAITEKATQKSLVIIDEVGEGTSPKDGEALGVALLKFFENVNCFTLLTSHFDGLKIYAAQDNLTLTGAMEFNSSNLTPTYRLLLHTTGKSYGLVLAKSIGLNPAIIRDAEDFENERANRDTDALMERLTEQESQNEKLRRELVAKKRELDRQIEKRQAAIQALNDEKGQIHQKAQEKVERLVEKRIAEMDAVWKSQAQTSDANYSEFSKAKGELNKMKVIAEPTLVGKGETELTDLKENDMVEDEDGRRGKVIEVKKKEVLLDMDGLHFRRAIKGLKRATMKTSDIKKKPKYTGFDQEFFQVTMANSHGMELNIIGLHVDEAMREVVAFVNEARVRKLPYIRIIHGMGSFALKNAVWKYLANHKDWIKDYSLGGEGDGGLGATIVHFKS